MSRTFQIVLAVLLASSAARAGGFGIPDIGQPTCDHLRLPAGLRWTAGGIASAPATCATGTGYRPSPTRLTSNFRGEGANRILTASVEVSL